MHVVGVVGPSDSGKTTLIERLVPRLGERGRVATVKSIHHDVAVDEPGKDTHRHRTAGAVATVGVAPTRTFGFLERGKAGLDGTDRGESTVLVPILDEFADHGVDYAIVEGFSRASIPKVALGPREGRDVSEPVVARVDGGESANLDDLVDEIEVHRRYETANSVVDGVHGSRSGNTVVVASLSAMHLASATDWTHDRIEGTLATIIEDVRARSAIEGASLDLRPPVAPGGTTKAHLAVTSANRERGFAVATEVLDRFVADAGIDAGVEYLVRAG